MSYFCHLLCTGPLINSKLSAWPVHPRSSSIVHVAKSTTLGTLLSAIAIWVPTTLIVALHLLLHAVSHNEQADACSDQGHHEQEHQE